MGSVDLPPFLREQQKQKVLANKSVPPFLKKKDEGNSVQNSSNATSAGLQDTSDQSEPNNGFDFLDPSKQFSTHTVTTPTGAVIPIDENKVPVLLRTPDFVNDIQKRINNGTTLPQDQQVISYGSGKKPEAVTAYISGDNKTGQAIDRTDFIEKNKAAIKNVIVDYNTKNGKAFNPDDILADPDKTSAFLAQAQEDFKNNIEVSKNFDKHDRSDGHVGNPDVGKFVRDKDIYTTPVNYQKAKYEKLFSDFQATSAPLLIQHITEETVKQDKQNGVPLEETYKNVAKRINPIGYANAQKALNTPTGVDSLSDKSSPGQIIGALYDEIKGVTDKDEVLNSVIGQGAISVNNAIFKMAQDNAAVAHLSGDANAMSDAKALFQEYDPNILKKYPSIRLQQMAAEISQDIAKDSGNLEGSDGADGAHNIGTKFFGETQQGYYKRMKEKGWFDNPDTRDLANKLLADHSYFSDASYFGSVGNSFVQPFKDLGLSVVDIAGIRNQKDIISDKVKDEMFPKETPDLTNFTSGLRTVVNTTSNLAGMVTIAAATGGIGRLAGIGLDAAETAELASQGLGDIRKAELLSKAASSNNTIELLSNATSFGLPSVDTNLKDSYNFIDNDAARAVYAGLGAILNTYGGKLLDLPKVSNVPGLKDSFTKLAEGISDKTLTEDAAKELLSNGQADYVAHLVKYGKNVNEGAAVMAYFTASNQILKSAFGDPNTTKDEVIKNTGHAYLDGVLGMLVFGAIKTKGEIDENKNSSYKGTLYNMALTPDATADIFKLGKKSDADFDSQMQILNTAVVAKKSLDAAMSERNIVLDQNQQAVFVANKTVEAYIRKQAESTTDENTKTQLLSKADKLREQSTATLDGLQFTSTLEPLYNLYNAEKERDQAANNFNSNPTPENDKIFQDKKTVYDDLHTKFNAGDLNKEQPKSDANNSIAKTPEELVTPFVGKGALMGMDAEQSLKFIAEQAQNVNGGQVSNIDGGYDATVNTFGEPLVKAAIEKHPLESLITTPAEVKTEVAPVADENVISVNDVLEKPATYKGQNGSFFVDGKTVVFKVDGKDKEYELGNVDEVGNQSIKDFGIEQINSVVSSNDAGNIVVRDKEYLNNYSDPLQAINRDKEGNIVSVNLETADGKKVTFRKGIAEDVAYQIHLKEITKDNETRQKFEDFINADEATAKEINDAAVPDVAKETATQNNEQVSSREKIEPVKNGEVIPDNIYEDFIDRGKVPEEIINTIADKIENQKELTERERVIFDDKTGLINKILVDRQKEGKNGLPFNKDKKDEYTTKSGRQKVFMQDGELVVKDAKTGEDVAKVTKKKALNEYADNFDFTHGKEVTETPADTVTDSDAKKYIVEHSENPYQIADIYVNEEPATHPLSDKETKIAEYGIQIHEKSFNSFLDRNKVTPAIRKAYIVPEKNIDTPAKRSLLGVDTLADEMSGHYHIDITPQDIVDFIERFPGGEKDALKLIDTDVSISAQERFKELTGFNLTHDLAEKVIDQKFELLDKKQQDILNGIYENEQQLTDEYWKQYEATNGFTEKIVDSETKPTETSGETKTVEDRPADGKGNKPPPPKKPAAPKEENADGSDDGTHINKKDITHVKELAKTFPIQGGSISWDESINSALESLSKKAKPDQSLFDVAKDKIAEWGLRIDRELFDNGKSTFNPTDEDLAVMSFYRTHLNQRLGEIKKELNSDSDIVRLKALNEAKDIQDQIVGVDRVLSESGKVAGRSFYIRQAVGKMDESNNLTVRRMDLMRSQDGEPLSADQESAIAKVVSDEAKLKKEGDNNIPKYSQEDFEAKVKEEVDRITKERKASKKNDVAAKNEKTLSQSGKEWADKIRKLKSDKDSLQLDITLGLRNLAVEAVAQLVEKGAKIADAIKEIIKDEKFKGLTEDDLTRHIINGIDHAENLDKIKELATKEKSGGLTKSAVGNGLINELVNHHIENGLRGKDVFEALNSDLKEIFPLITDQQVRDAYLKQGEFKLDRKPDLNKEIRDAKTELKNIVSLEGKLEDAKNNKVGDKSNSPKREITKAEADLRKKISSELNKRNIQFDRSPKEEISVKREVADTHNKRMKEVINSINEKLKDDTLTEDDKTALKQIKSTAELSKVNADTSQKIEDLLHKAEIGLRSAAVDAVGHEDIFDLINKSVSELSTDLKNSQQDIALLKHKKNLENRIKEAERKIEAQEFDEKEEVVRNKTNAEIIRQEIEAGKIESRYRRLEYLAQQKTKKWWEKGLSLGQTFLVNELIGGIKTAGVVLSSGLTKQPLNTFTNFTFGSLAHLLNPTLGKAAGAEAPFSIRQEANRYMAHYAKIGEKGMNEIFTKSENRLNEANKNYTALKDKLDGTDKNDKNYDSLKNQVKAAKNKQLNALITHQSNFIYKWIGSNAWKDSAQVFLTGASQLDVLLGKTEKVGWKEMTNFEKTEFVMSTMGALHGTFKNFSARAEFAAAFTARLENKARIGIDISQPDEVIKTANESYVNYLMGKYQEDNYVTSLMNRVGKLLEEVGNEPSKTGADRKPKNELLGKSAAAIYKGKYPIIRTGVNIGREAIVEYLLGTPIGAAIHGKEVAAAAIKAAKDGNPLMETIREHISQLSPDKVDLIFRCYRKGGFGLVLASMAAMGLVKFGGFYGDDDYKRRKGELKLGELELFGKKLDHGSILAKMYEHSGATMPSLMIANTRQVYERKISRGKTKGDKTAAINEALLSDLGAAARIIPVLNNSFQNPLTNMSVPYGRTAADISEAFDTDEEGHVIERDKSNWWNRFKINTGFRSTVPVKND